MEGCSGSDGISFWYAAWDGTRRQAVSVFHVRPKKWLPSDQRWGRGMPGKYNQEDHLMTGISSACVPLRRCLIWTVKAQTVSILFEGDYRQGSVIPVHSAVAEELRRSAASVGEAGPTASEDIVTSQLPHLHPFASTTYETSSVQPTEYCCAVSACPLLLTGSYSVYLQSPSRDHCDAPGGNDDNQHRQHPFTDHHRSRCRTLSIPMRDPSSSAATRRSSSSSKPT